MTLMQEIEILDKEIKKANLPFDKVLKVFRDKLWQIADKHNTTGAEVFNIYMNWKSEK